MKKALYYNDICLIPSNYSSLESRDLADTTRDFLGIKAKVPVILANMESVVNEDICKYLSENDYFYVMHRFGYTPSGLSATKHLVHRGNMEDWKLISVSTGVNKDSMDDLEWINAQGYAVDVVTIDVALGFHRKVKERIQQIQKLLPGTKIIAGNVAEKKGARFLADLGVDAIKTGIGQGGACSTRFQTGFTAPMLWAIEKTVEGADDVPVIADGGITCIGDIAKAMVWGASMVMSGKLFASCIDSAAKINEDGTKQYYGSASFQSKKHAKHVEGFALNLEANCTIAEKLSEVQQALQSSISYAGGHSLEAFESVEYLMLR